MATACPMQQLVQYVDYILENYATSSKDAIVTLPPEDSPGIEHWTSALELFFDSVAKNNYVLDVQATTRAFTKKVQETVMKLKKLGDMIKVARKDSDLHQQLLALVQVSWVVIYKSYYTAFTQFFQGHNLDPCNVVSKERFSAYMGNKEELLKLRRSCMMKVPRLHKWRDTFVTFMQTR